MFSFGFSVDDDGDIAHDVTDGQPALATSTAVLDEEPAQAVALEELFAALPARISYSPLLVRKADGSELHIARRDLFDARYQLLSGDDADDASGLEFIDAPSDLVRGVYEGGLKTWECASDLVQFISSGTAQQAVDVLELGCGTAIPSAYVLGEMFSTASSAEDTTYRTVQVQDYNKLVLELVRASAQEKFSPTAPQVALPNLILAWYFSPAASRVRDPSHESSAAGELDLDAELLAAFLADLASHSIKLNLYFGSWRSWQLPQTYDLVLSSETVYEPASLPALVSLLHSTGGQRLIAAKRVYFGVGGGIREFVQELERAAGSAETVWETSTGVARAILDVRW